MNSDGLPIERPPAKPANQKNEPTNAPIPGMVELFAGQAEIRAWTGRQDARRDKRAASHPSHHGDQCQASTSLGG